MNTLAKILSSKQTKYDNINYHAHTRTIKAQTASISIKIPPSLYNKIDSESDIRIFPVCTQDSFLHAILLLFDDNYSDSDWITKSEKAQSLKTAIINNISDKSILNDIIKGGLYNKDTISFFSVFFGINIVIAADDIYIKTLGKPCITIILIESDREIYYPVSIDDVLLHKYSVLNIFEAEK